MKIVKICVECGHRAPVHRGIGTESWCKDCSHLAPEVRIPVIKPKPGRTVFTGEGEKINESKEPETRRV